jgi:hypothetical protein
MITAKTASENAAKRSGVVLCAAMTFRGFS